MSTRWQSHLILTALCAAVAGGSSTSVAVAQCSHGGGTNSRFSQGLIAQQMLQQQQLLQQVLQQQLLQTAKLDRQMSELAKEGPEAIKTALKDPNAEMRLIAVLTVGKYGPALMDDLIERLTDDDASVRQAARRGLVSLSTQREDTPRAGRSVDFGPAANANRAAQNIAARKWRAWFERPQQRGRDLQVVAAQSTERPAAPNKDALAAPVAVDKKASQLGKELIAAAADQRNAVLDELRESKGAVYTQALAKAIPQLTGLIRARARDALAERLTRMTDDTLATYLRDEDVEIRRAAALACAMKEMNSRVPDLIALLEDANPTVPPAARAALKSLTNQDFGSVSQGDAAERQRVVASWKAWWQKHRGL
jgi:HEAT repeat protein